MKGEKLEEGKETKHSEKQSGTEEWLAYSANAVMSGMAFSAHGIATSNRQLAK